ncbi:MAG: hypothetical protein J6Q69_03695 [Clostridia bacterium]|nr:hypothetical protein [Clostridia bacterium]
MKRFLSLVLCLVFVVCALVSCGDEVVDPVPEHYPETQDSTIDRTVDLYMIVGEETPKTVYDSVTRMIYAYVLKTYDIELNVKFEYDYTKKDEQGNVVSYFNKDLTTLTAGGTKSAIVLVYNDELMGELEAASDNPELDFSLLDLSGYLTTTKFGKLNKDLPDALLEAATVQRTEIVYDEKGQPKLDENNNVVTQVVDKLFAMPNNRVLGHYEYLVIDKDMARDTLKYSPETLLSYNTYEATEQLRADIANFGYGFDPDDYVKRVTGTYSDRFTIEAEGNYCNVFSVPEVTSKDAFRSAFAIADTGNTALNDKAMQIIYALNYDTELRNLLQYGVRNTNYIAETVEVVDANGNTVEVEYITREGGDNTYRINPLHTGNMFVMAYCEELGWTYEYAVINGTKQNADVIFAEE